MVAAMSRRFPGGRLVFDAAGKTAVKADAENMGETRRHSGCGSLFFSGTCQSGVGPLGREFKGFQPWIYAGL